MADDSRVWTVSTPAQLAELVVHLTEQGRFAFDTEFVSEDTYEPILCLIQVATAERLVIVDPIAVRDVQPFWEVVTNPNLEVVMHAAGEDLRICHLQSGRLPARIVDVQLAAGFVGYGYPSSLSTLAFQTLRVSLSSGETRTDWRKRPLTPAQLQYALDDVRYLLRMADQLSDRLRELGRLEWAEAEYQELIRSVAARDDANRWRRLSGLGPLNRRSLEMARRLWDWRRREARSLNRPVRQFMRDDILVGIARRQPASKADLEALRDFNRPALLAHSRTILDILEEARQVPAEQLPEIGEKPEDAPGVSMVVSVLTAVLNRTATEARMNPGLVGTASDLRDLVRWYLAGSPPDSLPALLEGWRKDLSGSALLEVLSGRRSLRIIDPASELPVAIDPFGGPEA